MPVWNIETTNGASFQLSKNSESAISWKFESGSFKLNGVVEEKDENGNILLSVQGHTHDKYGRRVKWNTDMNGYNGDFIVELNENQIQYFPPSIPNDLKLESLVGTSCEDSNVRLAKELGKFHVLRCTQSNFSNNTNTPIKTLIFDLIFAANANDNNDYGNCLFAKAYACVAKVEQTIMPGGEYSIDHIILLPAHVNISESSMKELVGNSTNTNSDSNSDSNTDSNSKSNTDSNSKSNKFSKGVLREQIKYENPGDMKDLIRMLILWLSVIGTYYFQSVIILRFDANALRGRQPVLMRLFDWFDWLTIYDKSSSSSSLSWIQKKLYYRQNYCTKGIVSTISICIGAVIHLHMSALTALTGPLFSSMIIHDGMYGQVQEVHSELILYFNGWNAWSFCGTIQQHHRLLLHAMPSLFVRNFHSGGAAFARHCKESDGVWSDMFCILTRMCSLPTSVTSTRVGHARAEVTAGFLSQVCQFGAVKVSENREQMLLLASGDGAYCSGLCVQTDWAVIMLSDYDCYEAEPLSPYLELSASVSGAKDKMASYLKTAANMACAPGVENSNVSNMTSTSRSQYHVPAGWCSWYQYFEHITYSKLDENIDCMTKMIKGLGMNQSGFKLFQIDDGYQSAWGDWLHISERFNTQHEHITNDDNESDSDTTTGNGGEPLATTNLLADAADPNSNECMKDLVTKICKEGLLPGLWLAPFAADQWSQTSKINQSWILRYKTGMKAGRPMNSANCGKFFHCLDVTNPEVQKHVRKCISTAISKWKFRYLKLDFLYAAAVEGASMSYHDPRYTQAMAMNLGLKLIDDTLNANDAVRTDSIVLRSKKSVSTSSSTSPSGSVALLGCGAPLGSCLGFVHANRISCDAGLSWFAEFPLPYWDEWNLPSARSMLRNTISRMSMHGRWWINDPDCVILRDKGVFLTDDEITGLSIVKAFSGGSFILSDDLNLLIGQGKVSAVLATRLRLLQSLLPSSGRQATVIDLMERAVPELLRLEDDTSSKYLLSTTMAICNWGEYLKSHILDIATIFGAQTDSLIDKKTKTKTKNVTAILHYVEPLKSRYQCKYVDLQITANGTFSQAVQFDDVPCHGARIFQLACDVSTASLSTSSNSFVIGSNMHYSGDEFEFDSNNNGSLKIRIRIECVRDDNWASAIWVFVSSKNLKPPKINGSCVSPIRDTHLVQSFNHGNVWKVPIAKPENENSHNNGWCEIKISPP